MRIKITLFIFVMVWAIIIARLYQVSIKSGFYYEKLAKENIEHKEYLRPVRGEIVDVNGDFLAINKIGFSLLIAPHLSRGRGELDKVISLIKDTFPNIDTATMKKVYKKHSSPYNHKYIKVIDFVSYNDMIRKYPELSINEHIKIEAETKRYYPYGKYAAHIVGYIGKSNKKENNEDNTTKQLGRTGKSGIEKYYNKVLQGELGYEITMVNARNKALKTIEKKESLSNRNIELNIDMRLQKYIYNILGKKAAIVVVMKPTGEVLSAVSNPSYDPNLFVDGISFKNWKELQQDLDHPFTNKFINAVYPPGSVIKMGVALAASRANPHALDAIEHCNGYMYVGKSKHKFRCWSKYGHGDVGLRKSIRESCDVYYYNKSLSMGVDNMSKTLKEIGLGVKTGIDLPREYNGIIPNKAWKDKRYHQPWYMGETVIAAIGQGYDNITPMQIARYTAFLATGKLVTPRVAKTIDKDELKIESKIIPFESRFMREIRYGMYDVCNNSRGTAFKAMSDLPIVVAGKTGTAQVVSIPQDIVKRVDEKSMAYLRRSHAWFTSYAPFRNPEYVVTVLYEHGSHGGSSAGPIAANIYRWLYQNGYFKKHPIPTPEVDADTIQLK